MQKIRAVVQNVRVRGARDGRRPRTEFYVFRSPVAPVVHYTIAIISWYRIVGGGSEYGRFSHNEPRYPPNRWVCVELGWDIEGGQAFRAIKVKARCPDSRAQRHPRKGASSQLVTRGVSPPVIRRLRWSLRLRSHDQFQPTTANLLLQGGCRHYALAVLANARTSFSRFAFPRLMTAYGVFPLLPSALPPMEAIQPKKRAPFDGLLPVVYSSV
jgi:hypothetical protein